MGHSSHMTGVFFNSIFLCACANAPNFRDATPSVCSQTCPAGVRFTLKRVNELEVAVLSALRYNVKVLASEYAKYYFLMRSMLIKSGLGAGDETMTPLDVEGAKRLQHVSALYQSSARIPPPAAASRSKSVGSIQYSRGSSESSILVHQKKDCTGAGKVGLEHVVAM